MSDDAGDGERYPTLTDAGRRMLRFLHEHPAAPLYRNRSGNKLTAEEVQSLRIFEREAVAAAIGWSRLGEPYWLREFVAKTFTEVPYYRRLGSPPRHLADLPTVSRADLAHDIATFVPDTVGTDRLINFRTTGTTGHPLLIASHPLVAGRYLAFHKRALHGIGIELAHRSGQVGVVLLGHQQRCFTYVSVTPTMDESGLAKINLHPDDWRDPDHRAQYLDALSPEVYAGDPVSFGVLADLPLTHRPRALISVSMTLLPGMRQRLESHFDCPVLDVYSMNEAGPIAVYDEQVGGHRLLQPKLYVEIVDREGRPVPEGERGEITLSGGFNFCLPLLRYRTGDCASLEHGPHGPVLRGLSGRPPVRFRTLQGCWRNNIDVSHALGALPLPQFGLHQGADGSLALRLTPAGLHLADAARAALAVLFPDQAIAVDIIVAGDKIVQYTSALCAAD